jgi:hypothetical protein
VMVLVFAVGALGERVLHRWPITRGRFELCSGNELAKVWLLFVGCVVASLATPNTIDGLIYPFTYLGDNASTRYIDEWFPPDFSQPQYWSFALLALVAVLILGMALRRRLIGLTELGFTIPFGVMAMQSTRNITQFAVCAVPVIASALSTSRPQHGPEPQSVAEPRKPRNANQITDRQRATIAATCSIVCVTSLMFLTRDDLTPAQNATARQQIMPLAATEWLVDHPGGTVFNHYSYGGWLVLSGIPVFVDGRPDMYGDAFMDEYVRLTVKRTSTDWQTDMARVGADRVLVPKDSLLSRQIGNDIASGKAPGWYEPTEDPIARLFVQK